MIAIIAALTAEINDYRNSLQDQKVEKVLGQEYYLGRLYGKDVVLCHCGVGKVNSAASTAIVIDRYKADYIINTGVSGGIKARLLEPVIATAGVQHDVDFTALGDPIGHIDGQGVYIPAGKTLVEAFSQVLPDAQQGTIASGDMFVATKKKTDDIYDKFGAIAVDCETAAIMQVANKAGVEAIALRVMSDNADEKAPMSFQELVEKASIIAASAVKQVIQIL